MGEEEGEGKKKHWVMVEDLENVYQQNYNEQENMKGERKEEGLMGKFGFGFKSCGRNVIRLVLHCLV